MQVRVESAAWGKINGHKFDMKPKVWTEVSPVVVTALRALDIAVEEKEEDE